MLGFILSSWHGCTLCSQCCSPSGVETRSASKTLFGQAARLACYKKNISLITVVACGAMFMTVGRCNVATMR